MGNAAEMGSVEDTRENHPQAEAASQLDGVRKNLPFWTAEPRPYLIGKMPFSRVIGGTICGQHGEPAGSGAIAEPYWSTVPSTNPLFLHIPSWLNPLVSDFRPYPQLDFPHFRRD